MFELLSYVKAPKFYVRFLCRSDVFEFQRSDGQDPEEFLNDVFNRLEPIFSDMPTGTTPALERIKESLERYPNQTVLRYFMGDGVPNGGPKACDEIRRIMINRSIPEKNPFTFISCTNDDVAVEWMKETEEVAPYCSEFDDYGDEAREIVKDQGKAFPYSFGLHLVGILVAAYNPHDLDAMDESVPFTKATLEDLLGYQTSKEEYRYYFESFIDAQKLIQRSSADYFMVKFAHHTLHGLYSEFESAPRALETPAVSEYKQQIKQRQQTG